MNIYHLPGTGIFGGIKVGYQFASLLCDLEAPCLVATPDGRAPQWFRTSAPTISHSDFLERVQPSTNVLFSYPPDYEALRATGANLIIHYQGPDDRLERVLANLDVRILTCWPQAHRHILQLTGRQTTDVGIPISRAFYYDGADKIAGTVAYMPRRGRRIVKACRWRSPWLRYVPIDGQDETTTASIMKSAEYYLATSLNEGFGLPAFEAMAAGAVVISVPVIGGMDYLRHGENCIIASPDKVPDVLSELAKPENASLRASLRHAGRMTALEFLENRQKARVARLLPGALSYLRQPVPA